MFWRKIIGYWKSWIVVGAIAYGCLLREPLYLLPPIEHKDKWIHWLAFMILTIVLLWDSHKMGLKTWNMWVVASVIPVIYGGFIEILQEKFLYPRTGDWIDWLADCIGVIMGIGLWLIGQKWYERRMAQ